MKAIDSRVMTRFLSSLALQQSNFTFRLMLFDFISQLPLVSSASSPRGKLWSFLLHRPRFFFRPDLDRGKGQLVQQIYLKASTKRYCWSLYQCSRYLSSQMNTLFCMMSHTNRWFHLAETGCGTLRLHKKFIASKWEKSLINWHFDKLDKTTENS